MLATTIFCLAMLAGLVLFSAVLLFAVECVTGVWPARSERSAEVGTRPSAAILVPAHNESAGLADALRNIVDQMRAGDRLIVVADNCDDDTAEIARVAGAEVVVRNDPTRRGKGYALDAGVRYLRQAPCGIVIIVDADCHIEPNSLDALAGAAASSGRPIQARYLVQAPPRSGPNLAVAEFAFLVKNHLRPLGLFRLGLPCQLTGSGMAFPWHVIVSADLATGHRVEDMKLGLDLAAAGHPPLFCDQAVVTSFFPHSAQGLETQRQRWEGGHLSMIRFAFGCLFRTRSLALPYLVMLLDVMVPPLTLLVAASIAVFAIALGVAGLGFGLSPLLIATAAILLMFLAVGSAWFVHGRALLPFRDVLQIARYVASKSKLYPKVIATGKDSSWIRTDRSSGN